MFVERPSVCQDEQDMQKVLGLGSLGEMPIFLYIVSYMSNLRLRVLVRAKSQGTVRYSVRTITENQQEVVISQRYSAPRMRIQIHAEAPSSGHEASCNLPLPSCY